MFSYNVQDKFAEYIQLIHHFPSKRLFAFHLFIPKKSSKIISLSSILLYFFYFGASIIITFIFFRFYSFIFSLMEVKLLVDKL